MATKRSLELGQKSLNDVLKNIGKNESKEPCPVCENELYYDEKLSKKCALLDEYDNILGWICPYCRSEFDNSDNLVEMFKGTVTKGKA